MAGEMETPTEESIWLWDEGKMPAVCEESDFKPWIDKYLVDSDSARGGVLICPGGGYGHRAPHEGTEIAKEFNKNGINAFVVQYRVNPNLHPAPLHDVARALRIIRKNASAWNVDAGKIAVCGFSAGGHLAASIGVHYNDFENHAEDDLSEISCRPDALILCYPVIKQGEFSHQGSFSNLLGEDATEDMLHKMSLEKHIDGNTPPAFLWHTSDDPAVPVENSLLFTLQMRKHNVPVELHVFKEGRHGLGLSKDREGAVPAVSAWFGLCCQWLADMGWK
jgi:acetyl esterase/lipase